MFAHSIASCVRRDREYYKQHNIEEGLRDAEADLYVLERAQRFYLGDLADMPWYPSSYAKYPVGLGPMAPWQVPPYEMTLWMWTVKHPTGGYEKPEGAVKRACLVLKVPTRPVLIFRDFYYPDEGGGWRVMPFRCAVSVGAGLKDVFPEIGGDAAPNAKGANIYPYPDGYLTYKMRDGSPIAEKCKKYWNDNIRTVLGEQAGDWSTCLDAMAFLNCKNASTVEVEPDPVENRRRVKRGKKPLLSYKTLVVKPLGRRVTRGPGPEEPGYHVRVHLQRGHFKEYKEEAPLLGKFAGLFWWNPHVRGSPSEGLVLKEYSVAKAEGGQES